MPQILYTYIKKPICNYALELAYCNAIHIHAY